MTITTKTVRVPGAVAVVFQKAGQKLNADNVVMMGGVSSLSHSNEAHEPDWEPGTEDYKAKAMDARQNQPCNDTQAFVFEDNDGRSQGATVDGTVEAVNAALKPQGLLARMTRRFG